MELQELLRRRRMVRNYLPDPVPREVLERIVSTVRRAPSGGYSQGQRLLVITDADIRSRIAALVGEPERVEQGFEPWISHAPLHVFALAREEDYHERYRRPDKLQDGHEIEWPVPYWYVDAGAAMMLLLLATIDEGLAAGVFGLPQEAVEPFKTLVGIPADLHFVAVVTLGRPADDPRWSEVTSRRTQPRRALDDVVRWDRWA